MYNIEEKLSFKEVSLFIIILNVAFVSPNLLSQISGIEIREVADILNGLTERNIVTCINNKYVIKSENVEGILYENKKDIDYYNNDEQYNIELENVPLLEYLYSYVKSL